MSSANDPHPLEAVQALVMGWCDRRCLKALRSVLSGYPLSSPFTDGWGELLRALQDVRAFAGDEITPADRDVIDQCIRDIEKIVYRT